MAAYDGTPQFADGKVFAVKLPFMSIYFVLAIGLLNGTVVQASRVVLPLYALDLDASALTVGLLGASFAVLPLILSVPFGKFADRFGVRWMLVLGALGGGAGMYVPYIVPEISALFVASAVMGLTFGIFSVSLQNLVGQLSSVENRAQYFSNHSLAASGGNFLGPLIAGFSVEHSGNAEACLYLAGLSLVPAAMLAIWGGAFPRGERAVTRATGGIGTLLSEPGMKKTLTASGLLLAGQDLYRIYMPVYGHTIGLTASTIGLVLAAFPAASFFVRLIMKWLVARFREENLLVASFYAAAVCLVLIPLFKDAFVLATISFVFGLGMGCSQPIITMLMYGNSPPGRSAEALGLRMSVVHFTRLIGPVTFGAIGSALGLLPMFVVNALMMGAGGLLSRPANKNPELPDKPRLP